MNVVRNICNQTVWYKVIFHCGIDLYDIATLPRTLTLWMVFSTNSEGRALIPKEWYLKKQKRLKAVWVKDQIKMRYLQRYFS